MHGRGLLFLLGLTTFASWVSLGALVVYFSPENAIAWFLFFAFLFVGVLFTFASLAHYVSLKFFPSPWHGREFRASIVRGLPPAVAVMVAAFLQSLRSLGTISGIVLLVAVLLVELVLIVRGRKDRGTRRVQGAGD